MIKVKNWSSYQSYKDRLPPWIRLHRSLLDNYEFQMLSVESRAFLPMLWLLACEDEDPTSGIIKYSIDKISFRLRQNKETIIKSIKELQDADFIECIESVTESLRTENESVTPETETETETYFLSPSNEGRPPNVPVQEILNAYHEILPELPAVQIMSDKRNKYLRQRWREDPKRQNIAWWRKYFSYVKKSDFLMGRKDDGSWTANFEWLITSSKLIKVIEGEYHRD